MTQKSQHQVDKAYTSSGCQGNKHDMALQFKNKHVVKYTVQKVSKGGVSDFW